MPQPQPRHPANYWIKLVLVGLAGGLLAGAFGVGGGVIMVPLLVSVMSMDQRQAAVTSLIAVIPSSVVGAITYGVAGDVDLPVALAVAIGAVLGSVIGGRLLRRLSLPWLRWMFIVLLLLIAARMLLIEPERGEQLELGWLVLIGLLSLGLVMGIASGLFGIGGGVIAVPVLIAVFGIGDLVAKGTSLLIMIPTALVGTASNLRTSSVDLRPGAVVGTAAAVAAVGGAAVAFLMTPRVSSVLFAALLLVAVVQPALKAIRQPPTNS